MFLGIVQPTPIPAHSWAGCGSGGYTPAAPRGDSAAGAGRQGQAAASGGAFRPLDCPLPPAQRWRRRRGIYTTRASSSQTSLCSSGRKRPESARSVARPLPTKSFDFAGAPIMGGAGQSKSPWDKVSQGPLTSPARSRDRRSRPPHGDWTPPECHSRPNGCWARPGTAPAHGGRWRCSPGRPRGPAGG